MPSARLDGLKLRVEEFGKKTTQFYDGSKDNLVYRSASYHQTGAAAADASTTPDALAPRKMTEKFRRDVSKDAEDDVIKRTFGLVGSGAIKVGFAAAPLPLDFDHSSFELRPSTLYPLPPTLRPHSPPPTLPFPPPSLSPSQVVYHYGDDRVTASFRHYAKDGTDHLVVQVDPYSRPTSTAVQLEEFQKLQACDEVAALCGRGCSPVR